MLLYPCSQKWVHNYTKFSIRRGKSIQPYECTFHFSTIEVNRLWTEVGFYAFLFTERNFKKVVTLIYVEISCFHIYSTQVDKTLTSYKTYQTNKHHQYCSCASFHQVVFEVWSYTTNNSNTDTNIWKIGPGWIFTWLQIQSNTQPISMV